MSDHARPRRGTLVRWLSLLLILGAPLSLAGCLVIESEEETFTLREDGQRGQYTILLRNIQSDGATPHHQQEDFNTLVSLLTGDDYLLDRLRGGVYVKSRAATVERGVLVARETGLFSDPSNMGLTVMRDSTLRRSVNRQMTVTATTGRVIQDGDSVYVQWPKRTREFKVQLREKEFQPAANLVERFEAWRKKRH
jgi:hypothetical protein